MLSLAASAPASANLGNNDQEEHEDNEEEEEEMEEVEVVEEEQQEVTQAMKVTAAYNEHEICSLLKNNVINLTEVWATEEDSSFRKIRNGLYQERTPPTEGKKQHKRQNLL
ncbi:hypothetical protein E2C01_051612 [Portunus trituberculatus]|uniref:Uncharacterized protein n=1 Tax=Portunus trituberculatus TaxID=210409 RepID=A0A5B7GK20_PORTR|nr:hypothetical protein [Portunus trituberculatus]